MAGQKWHRAVGATADFLERLEESSPLMVARFVLFSDDALAAFESVLGDWP